MTISQVLHLELVLWGHPQLAQDEVKFDRPALKQ